MSCYYIIENIVKEIFFKRSTFCWYVFISSFSFINDNLLGIKGQIENIINYIVNKKEINSIDNQIKNINIIINNAIGEIKKNDEKLKQLKNVNDKSNDIIKNSNIIKGVLDINLKDIKNGVILLIRKVKME